MMTISANSNPRHRIVDDLEYLKRGADKSFWDSLKVMGSLWAATLSLYLALKPDVAALAHGRETAFDLLAGIWRMAPVAGTLTIWFAAACMMFLTRNLQTGWDRRQAVLRFAEWFRDAPGSSGDVRVETQVAETKSHVYFADLSVRMFFWATGVYVLGYLLLLAGLPFLR